MGKSTLKKLKGMRNLSLGSLLACIFALTIIFYCLEPNYGGDIVFYAFCIVEVIDWAQPQRIPNFLAWWDGMANIVHIGLILVAVGVFVWMLDLVGKLFKFLVRLVGEKSNLKNQPA